MPDPDVPSTRRVFERTLKECERVGANLRKHPPFVHKHVVRGRSKAACEFKAPASPWPSDNVIFRCRQRGFNWFLTHRNHSCIFCENPSRHGRSRIFAGPEDMVAHLRVFHPQFDYKLEIADDSCSILLKPTKNIRVYFHEQPEFRTGAELLYFSPKILAKFPNYIVPTPSVAKNRQRIGAVSEWGREDDDNHFVVIKSTVPNLQVPDNVDYDLDETDNVTITPSKKPSSSKPSIPLSGPVAQPSEARSSRGPTANLSGSVSGKTGNANRASGKPGRSLDFATPSSDDISTTPSPQSSPVDLDELPDRFLDMQKALRIQEERARARKERNLKKQETPIKKQKMSKIQSATRADGASSSRRLESTITAAQGHPGPEENAQGASVRTDSGKRSNEPLIRTKKRVVRTPIQNLRQKSPSPNPERRPSRRASSSVTPNLDARPKRVRTPPQKLDTVITKKKGGPANSKPRPKKRTRKEEYIPPELGPLVIQPGPVPVNDQGLPQLTQEFVKSKLFHTILNRELIVEDFNQGYDSDGEESLDVDWRLEFKNSLLHDFVDMYAVEKMFMSLWNQFTMKEYEIIGDRNVFPACHAFLDKYGPEIRRMQFECLFLRHLTVLSQCGLVDASGVFELLMKLKNIEPATAPNPNFLFAFNIATNQNFERRSYKMGTWSPAIPNPSRDLEGVDHFNTKSLFPKDNPYASHNVGIPGEELPPKDTFALPFALPFSLGSAGGPSSRPGSAAGPSNHSSPAAEATHNSMFYHPPYVYPRREAHVSNRNELPAHVGLFNGLSSSRFRGGPRTDLGVSPGPIANPFDSPNPLVASPSARVVSPANWASRSVTPGEPRPRFIRTSSHPDDGPVNHQHRPLPPGFATATLTSERVNMRTDASGGSSQIERTRRQSSPYETKSAAEVRRTVGASILPPESKVGAATSSPVIRQTNGMVAPHAHAPQRAVNLSSTHPAAGVPAYRSPGTRAANGQSGRARERNNANGVRRMPMTSSANGRHFVHNSPFRAEQGERRASAPLPEGEPDVFVISD